MSNSGRADALLADLSRDGRGRLKVFLGAAPGVGKTYAMLQAAMAAPKPRHCSAACRSSRWCVRSTAG
jgi:K+-sensing histidine kinase KdpD